MHHAHRLNSVLIPDAVICKVLNKDLDLMVEEEPLPVSPNPLMVSYTINRNIVGNMIVHDPTIPCTRTNDVPRLISFVSWKTRKRFLFSTYMGIRLR